jgi:hypothetical protein
MSDRTGTARRYHWLSESVTSFVNEPHAAICSDLRAPTLNLVAAEHDALRSASVELAGRSPERVMSIIERHGHNRLGPSLPFEMPLSLEMPRRHGLELQDFEALLGVDGVGARTLRALALVSEVIYGTPASTRDPARFAFAHGGKDGTPFPVDREAYDRTIDTLHRAMAAIRVDRSDKIDALKRLARFARNTEPVPTP